MRRFGKRAAALIAVALVCGIAGVGSAYASETPQSNNQIQREGNTLYANGVAVVIKKDVDGKTYVFDEAGATKLDEAPFAGTPTVYGGGKGQAVEGDTSIAVEGVYVSTIYGGGWNAPVSGSVRISVSDANTSTLYGGGYSDGTSDASVGGDVTIDLAGTGAKTGLHGGGYAVATNGEAVADVAGAVTLNCENFNHQGGSSVLGGGNAFAAEGHSAHASVGSVRVTGAGPTYVVRSGGSATSKAEGSACADVLGAVSLNLSQVDAREIYGGGYASGVHARATVGSVEANVVGDEVMILQGGGQSSGGGVADVVGAIKTAMSDCYNLYGYVCGGGVAYSGGSSKAASASLSLVNCDVPVDVQWGDLVAAAVYGGGSASGAGSSVDIANSASLSIASGKLAGSLYGGGEATGGASASVGSLSIALSDMQGSPYEDGNTYVPSLYLAGETDAESAATFGAFPVSAMIENCPLEHVWGAVSDDQPLEVSGASTVTLRGSTSLTTLANIDAVDIEAPLSIAAYKQNADAPTMITARGIATGEPAIICDDRHLEGSWFALRGGELTYAVEEGKSVWRIAKRHATVETPVDDPAAPSVSVGYDQDELEALLTGEERAALDAGTPVSFALSVKTVEPDAVDKPANDALQSIVSQNSLVIAEHLDISFSKIVGDRATPLAETGTPLKLEIAIPDKLLAAEGEDERVFSVVRVHERADGTLETAVLPDLDKVAETVTVETDRFSMYALAYAKAADPTPDPNPDPDPNPGPNPNPNPGPTPSPDPDPTPGPDPNPVPKPVQPDNPATPDPEVPKHDTEVVEKNSPVKQLPTPTALAPTGDSLSVAFFLACAIVAGAATCFAVRRICWS